MGEVVYVNFQSRSRKDPADRRFSDFISDLIDLGLEYTDILEVIDAINDGRAYARADKDIQLIADIWYTHKNDF
jgi:hypothetical protein